MSEPQKSRRTQAERRAATRLALLDATIEVLVVDGWAGLTTRSVAHRAGVSAGAQHHHFPTRGELAIEALRHALRRLADEARERLRFADLVEASAREEAIDELWRLHRSQEFRALLELWVAAGTDTALREAVRGLNDELAVVLAAAPFDLLPEEPWDRRRLDAVTGVLAMVRGVAMLAPVLDEEQLDAVWAPARALLLELVLILRRDN